MLDREGNIFYNLLIPDHFNRVVSFTSLEADIYQGFAFSGIFIIYYLKAT